MKKIELTNFEIQILKWIQENRPIIADQIRKAEIIKRDYSGAGFFFTFSVPDEVTQIDQELKTIEGPAVKSNLLPGGGNSIVFCENGYIVALEVFSYDGSFPKELNEFELQESDVNKK